MSAATHTPGPWEVVPYGDGDSLVIHDARGDWRVCFMATPGESGDMRGIRANARLIASAPDLLAACQRAHRVIKAMTGNQQATKGNVIGELEAAIARATGDGQ